MMSSCQFQIAHLFITFGFFSSYKHSIETPTKENKSASLLKDQAPSRVITSIGCHILLTAERCSPYTLLENSARQRTVG